MHVIPAQCLLPRRRGAGIQVFGRLLFPTRPHGELDTLFLAGLGCIMSYPYLREGRLRTGESPGVGVNNSYKYVIPAQAGIQVCEFPTRPHGELDTLFLAGLDCAQNAHKVALRCSRRLAGLSEVNNPAVLAGRRMFARLYRLLPHRSDRGNVGPLLLRVKGRLQEGISTRMSRKGRESKSWQVRGILRLHSVPSQNDNDRRKLILPGVGGGETWRF